MSDVRVQIVTHKIEEFQKSGCWQSTINLYLYLHRKSCLKLLSCIISEWINKTLSKVERIVLSMDEKILKKILFKESQIRVVKLSV